MRRTLAALLAAGFAVAACGRGTKHEILSKAEGVASKAELEEVLGAPDDRAKAGPIETWTYRGSDGDVRFLVVGDAVTLQTTSERER